MVHRYHSVGFWAVSVQNANRPALNSDWGVDIAEATGELDDFLERAFVVHRRLHQGAASLADEFSLQRRIHQLDVAARYVLPQPSRSWVKSVIFGMQMLGYPQRTPNVGDHGTCECQLPAQHTCGGVDHLAGR